MHTPAAFVETDLAALDALFAHDAFVTLVTVGADGLPCANHLPVLYGRDGNDILIEGHWARANPQAAHNGTALMIVHGPHHYVSATWYPDKEAAVRVPTWNYAVAHLRGELQASIDTDFLADLVARLSDKHEASVGQDWRFDPGQQAQVQQLRGVIGFRFRPHDLEMQFKLSQNHPAANRQAVITALEAVSSENALAVASLMRARSN